MRVTVHHVLTGAAAQAGGVRFDIDGTAMILLAVDLSIENQAAILGELLHADDTICYAIIPQQRAADQPVEVAS